MLKMMKFSVAVLAVMFVTLASSESFAAEKAAVLAQSVKIANKKMAGAVDTKTCFACHTTVGALNERGVHKNVNCVACHTIPENHAKNPIPTERPTTNVSWQACSQCHSQQFESFDKVDMHRPARFDKSNATGRSPNPAWDKIMAPHGFTKEHAATRSHAVMLLDQFAVDRAFGGRFQPKNGWNYIFEKGKVWDILVDTHPEVPTQKAFMRQTATANNPVCMSCKTADHILDWAYMGDPADGAKWSRQSNSVEMAKAMQHSLNCFTCHDPHSAEPRIIQSGLIDAMTNPNATDNLYQQDPKKVKAEVIEMGERGFMRKIAILDKNDPRYVSLQCAQCHVEYNCNPGVNSDTKAPYTMASALTNHFPMKNALDLYDHYYGKIKFQDFANRFSGAPLWKAQHPEMETYYNSKHDKVGVSCGTCHTPQVKDAKGKLQYTSHFATSPRFVLAETCNTVQCHGVGAEKNWDPKKYSPEYIKASTNWDEKKALYSINSVKGYITSKLRKAEFWLVTLIDGITDAKRFGVDPAIIKKAQEQHTKAHILWEYWTAENSDGFHNPELAREAVTKSIDEAMAGYKMIEDALNEIGAMNTKSVADAKAKAPKAAAPAMK